MTTRTWQLAAPRRKGHVELHDLKPDYGREMEVKARWVAEWRQARERGDTERMKQLEGLLATSPISELGKGKR